MSVGRPLTHLRSKPEGRGGDSLLHIKHYLNVLVLIPSFAGFFVAANPSPTSGQWVTTYLDAVFMCFSAMTVCGLNVLSVSTLQPAQQAFLFILMLIGDIVSAVHV